MGQNNMPEHQNSTTLSFVRVQFIQIEESKYSEGIDLIEHLIVVLRRSGYDIPDIDKLKRVF